MTSRLSSEQECPTDNAVQDRVLSHDTPGEDEYGITLGQISNAVMVFGMYRRLHRKS